MRTYIGLTVAACVVMLATAGTGKAQSTITVAPGYSTPPEVSQHSGSYTTPPARIRGSYRVYIDFGKYVNNNYVPMAGSPGGPQPALPHPVTGVGNWNTLPPGVALNGNVANGNITHIRARFQQDANNNGNWVTITYAITIL
jgi:hypothetical protein